MVPLHTNYNIVSHFSTGYPDLVPLCPTGLIRTILITLYRNNILRDMEDITLRVARKEDCPRLMELIRELAAYEKAPEQVTVTLPHFEEAGFGPHPVWKAFVATTRVNGREVIHGAALYYVRYSTWKGCRMYLEDIIVTAAWRGKGIGKLLFDQLIKEAKEKEFNGIVFQVLEWNTPAINFYKKYTDKFDPEWINVSIELT